MITCPPKLTGGRGGESLSALSSLVLPFHFTIYSLSVNSARGVQPSINSTVSDSFSITIKLKLLPKNFQICQLLLTSRVSRNLNKLPELLLSRNVFLFSLSNDNIAEYRLMFVSIRLAVLPTNEKSLFVLSRLSPPAAQKKCRIH